MNRDQHNDRESFEAGDSVGARILSRLTTFRVDWSRARGKLGRVDPRDQPDYEPLIDSEEADIDKANIVSSLIRFDPKDFLADPNDKRHVLAIDLDIPATLVPSSTPGHQHLYVETKEGIPHHRYLALLAALADCGIIEEGYAAVSIARGHSDLRLPWVSKDDEIPAKAEAPAPPVQVAQSTPIDF